MKIPKRMRVMSTPSDAGDPRRRVIIVYGPRRSCSSPYSRDPSAENGPRRAQSDSYSVGSVAAIAASTDPGSRRLARSASVMIPSR